MKCFPGSTDPRCPKIEEPTTRVPVRTRPTRPQTPPTPRPTPRVTPASDSITVTRPQRTRGTRPPNTRPPTQAPVTRTTEARLRCAPGSRDPRCQRPTTQIPVYVPPEEVQNRFEPTCSNGGVAPYCCTNGVTDNPDCCTNGGKGKYCCENGANNPDCK